MPFHTADTLNFSIYRLSLRELVDQRKKEIIYNVKQTKI